ncbi:hypothetical protein ONS95_008900 [Cadophora gregata]|uniref:uncharacterized protein n=1 Tax=Cadophora gregata TaxID=51156 RepID=UPI0026DB44B2|nr:uncharacterized protein ONS95_008900 [Cadophora gregata]KAK0123908.1 hypothetical protein ONS95_008900 [Cadophora gregata]KAK0130249.1 hypothetical protein ONS96_000772 [Cadophora gregata f. sp. sojae]
MSEEPRGRKRFSSSGRRSETRKEPAVVPAIPGPSALPEAAYQQYSIPQQHRTMARNGPRRAVEPTHKPSDKDVKRQIKVCSDRFKIWTEVTATFVDDLMEAWISKEMVKELDLEAIPRSPGDPEWGLLGRRSVPLEGTTELQWYPKDCRRVKDTTCRIVDSKDFGIYLHSRLLPASPVSVNTSIAIESRSIPEPIPSLPVSPPRKIATADNVPFPEKASDTDTVIWRGESDQEASAASIGSFDGLPESISETSDEAKYADNWMALLKTKFHNHFQKKSDIVHDSVKIAVLDTGLDTTIPTLKGAINQKRIKVVKSFVAGDPDTADEFGHGTHVASLLLKVAPRAQVFVLKIAKTDEILSTKSVADAINHAANELRVDIITMSFGLDKEIAEVQAAIRNAFYKNILMFAAASNSGGNLEVKYPARKDEVICVYATDGSGNPFTRNPNIMPNTSFHFATLGVGVKSSWPKKPGEASERRQTGTSFATPIVAGIAACIIEFATVQDLPEELLAVLKTRQGMQKTLLKLMVDDTPRSGFHYVHPWKMFANDRSEESVLYAMRDILGS